MVRGANASDSGLCHTDSKQRLPSVGVLTDVLSMLEALSNNKEPQLMDALSAQQEGGGGGGGVLNWVPARCGVPELLIKLQRPGQARVDQSLTGENVPSPNQPSRLLQRRMTTTASTHENRLSFFGLELVTVASTSTCSGSSDWPRPQTAAKGFGERTVERILQWCPVLQD